MKRLSEPRTVTSGRSIRVVQGPVYEQAAVEAREDGFWKVWGEHGTAHGQAESFAQAVKVSDRVAVLYMGYVIP